MPVRQAADSQRSYAGNRRGRSVVSRVNDHFLPGLFAGMIGHGSGMNAATRALTFLARLRSPRCASSNSSIGFRPRFPMPGSQARAAGVG